MKNKFIIEDGVLIDYIGSKRKVIIPYGVKKIGKCAFKDCDNITSVFIPESVDEIDERLLCS